MMYRDIRWFTSPGGCPQKMIIVMKPYCTEKNICDVSEKLESLGLGVHISKGSQRTIIGVIGDKRVLDDIPLDLLEGVEKLVPVMESYKLASRSFKPEASVIDVNGVKIGGKEIVIMAGPCAVESREQVLKTARSVRKSGARFLRGGAFKPRTSPYSFQGLQEKDSRYLRKRRKKPACLL